MTKKTIETTIHLESVTSLVELARNENEFGNILNVMEKDSGYKVKIEIDILALPAIIKEMHA